MLIGAVVQKLSKASGDDGGAAVGLNEPNVMNHRAAVDLHPAYQFEALKADLLWVADREFEAGALFPLALASAFAAEPRCW